MASPISHQPVVNAVLVDDQRIDQSAEQRMPIASIADEHDELAAPWPRERGPVTV
jgi:hypothetical protein